MGKFLSEFSKSALDEKNNISPLKFFEMGVRGRKLSFKKVSPPQINEYIKEK